MPCPRCQSESTLRRRYRTSLGCRIYYCRNCKRRFNERTSTPYNHLQFPEDIVLMAVLWRLRYKRGGSGKLNSGDKWILCSNRA